MMDRIHVILILPFYFFMSNSYFTISSQTSFDTFYIHSIDSRLFENRKSLNPNQLLFILFIGEDGKYSIFALLFLFIQYQGTIDI